MKLKLSFVLVAFLVSGFGAVNAQKIVLESGDGSVIKAEKKLNIEFDYSEFGVGKFPKEADYVKSKKDEYNAKEPGRGDKWHESWIGDRKNRFEPKFLELINKGLEKKGMMVGSNPDTKYTLVVKTTFLEPGFNVGVMKRPASVSFKYIFYETANPSNVVAVYFQNTVPGSQFGGYDFDVGTRVAESYAKGGKMLAAMISKMK
jgi:hypothetical protein